MTIPVTPVANGAESTETASLASDVVLFLHAGGVPVDAISRQLLALGCFGRPGAHFDLDGPMWSAVKAAGADSFKAYLLGLVDKSRAEGGIFSALIDDRDLLWLEQRPVFRDQLRQRLRIVRLGFLDPALQAYRRVIANRQLRADQGLSDGPSFTALARELIDIEEDECLGDRLCRRYGVSMIKLWVEDLARPGVPSLRGLLDRWSLSLDEGATLTPIEPPTKAELDAVTAFRLEANRRHWSHALLPSQP